MGSAFAGRVFEDNSERCMQYCFLKITCHADPHNSALSDENTALVLSLAIERYIILILKFSDKKKSVLLSFIPFQYNLPTKIYKLLHVYCFS